MSEEMGQLSMIILVLVFIAIIVAVVLLLFLFGTEEISSNRTVIELFKIWS